MPAGALFALCAVIVGLFSFIPGNIPHRWTIVLWTSYLAVVFILGSSIAYLQKRVFAVEQVTLEDVYRKQQEAIDSTERARRADNRAYVGMDRVVMEHPILSGKNFHVTILAVNTGKTPAKNVGTKIYAEFGPLDKVPQGDRDFPRVGLPDNGVLALGTGTSLELGPK